MKDKIDLLKELVTKYRVCWDLWPEYYVDAKGQKIQVGFELDIVGTHYQPFHLPSPGCDECEKVYEDLRQIALWIIPHELRPSRYDIQIFDDALRYSKIRNFRPDVTLAVKIVHRDGFDKPVDVCELKCLNEMEEKLRRLGAWKGRFQIALKGCDPHEG